MLTIRSTYTDILEEYNLSQIEEGIMFHKVLSFLKVYKRQEDLLQEAKNAFNYVYNILQGRGKTIDKKSEKILGFETLKTFLTSPDIQHIFITKQTVKVYNEIEILHNTNIYRIDRFEDSDKQIIIYDYKLSKNIDLDKATQQIKNYKNIITDIFQKRADLITGYLVFIKEAQIRQVI